ncbi:MAG TPA: energy transducer TonB [Vicinamibacterales bacterium]|nr:energy transducer TonB [Vicinamibacterales bacterium]
MAARILTGLFLALLVAGSRTPVAVDQTSQPLSCGPGTDGQSALQGRLDAAGAAPAAFLPKLELARCLDLSWRFDDVAPAVELALAAFRSEIHPIEKQLPSRPALAGRDVGVPVRTKMMLPVYPDRASSEGITGIVIVEAQIDREGRVKRAEIVQSVPSLDKAAKDAVRKWQFAPAVMNGQIVEVLTYLPMKFGQSTTFWASDHLELARFFYQRGLWGHVAGALANARDLARRDADRIGVIAEGSGRGRTTGLNMPEVVKQQMPRYTSGAMKAKIMGNVELRALIDRYGDVIRTAVMKPLPMLNMAAEQAAMQWKFKPGSLNGQPISVSVGLVLEFRLR